MLEHSTRIIAAILLIVAGASVHAQVTYQYTGQTFAFAEPPYNTSDRITGSFELSEPLEPFMIGGDISADLVDFSFTDGQQTRTPGNSSICVFNVTTDGAGEIVGWGIVLREAPTPVSGSPQQTLDTTSQTDLVGTGVSDGTACGTFFILTDSAQNTFSPGTWTSNAVTTPVPTEYTFEGVPFSTVEPPNVPGQAISGGFTVSGPLPALFSADIREVVDDFSFTDGVDSFAFDGGDPFGGTICQFLISTDPWGRISAWTIRLALDPDPQPLSTQRLVTITGTGDTVETGDAALGLCNIDVTTSTSSVAQAGEWLSAVYPPLNPTRYDYIGQPYDTVDGAGVIGDSTRGSVTFERPLPAGLPLTSLEDYVVDFRFDDAIQTRTPADTTLCEFFFATGARGDIVQWDLLLREAPQPAEGALQESLDVRSSSLNVSAVGFAGPEPCATIGLDTTQQTALAGTWRVAGPPASIPVLGAPGLLLLAGLLALLAFGAMSRSDRPMRLQRPAGYSRTSQQSATKPRRIRSPNTRGTRS